MADVTPAPVAAASKKTPTKKPKAKASAPTHPKASDMVLEAVKQLKAKKGSSLPAIKKFIAAHYKVDADKMATFIRRALKKAVIDGTLLQIKGIGANGSFKVAAVEKAPKKPKKVAAATTPKKKKVASTADKKKKIVKKAAPKKKAATTSATKKATTTPKKAKKSPKKVTKSPKPKKAPSKPKAKKAVAKK